METSIKSKKARMREGIMPIKSLQGGWRRDTFQAQYPMWNCSWIPWKKKARMGEGVMSIKLFCAGWRREILYANPVSCLELFIATTEKEKISWIAKNVNSMNSKSQDRRGDSVKRTKNAKTSTLKRCLLTTKDQAQTY